MIKVRCLIRDEQIREVEDEVVEEKPLSIFVNGRQFITAMISPRMKREFVIGHLFSEGIIKNPEEIESLQIQENIARVLISNPLKILTRRTIVSGCGGGSSFLDESKLPEIESDLEISGEDIFDAIKSISGSELHRTTGGVHSCGIFTNDKIICISKDIGRHNALDKVIGHALIVGYELSDAFVATTGRISSDMALKCSTANIPLIASRGATTSLAIDIGKRTGLTIVGFVRGSKMNIYTNEHRIG
jgi:FdhD protein